MKSKIREIEDNATHRIGEGAMEPSVMSGYSLASALWPWVRFPLFESVRSRVLFPIWRRSRVLQEIDG